MLAAKYDQAEPVAWQGHCAQISPFDAPSPPFTRSWWPSDVPARRLSTYRQAFFHCGDSVFSAWGQGEFYYWRSGDGA